MAEISIVVPVYKSEKYIARCIDSLLCQTLSDIEVILVDDGSPDDCPKICDAYAAKDDRVKVIHKQNGGVAAARNTGIGAATGSYITFVDSDDWIEPDMYRSMMAINEQYDCDVVMCDCVKDFPDHAHIYSHDIRGGYYDKQQMDTEYRPHLLMMENVEYPATISNCLCLIKANLVLPGIRYVEGIRFSEDLLFGAEVMYYAGSFYYMKGQAFYHYCMNPGSATHAFTLDKWKDYTALYHAAETFFAGKGPIFVPQLDRMLLFLVYNAVGNISHADALELKEKRKMIYGILREAPVRKMFSRTCVCRLPISWKLKIITFMYKYRIGLRLLFRR